MELRFTMLGSGAVRSNPRRGGPAQVLRIDDTALVFDCGRNCCTALTRAGMKTELTDRLFLTHLHFDHVIGVPYFILLGWNNGRKNPLRIFGPEGTEEFVTRVIRPPFRQDIETRLGHGKDPFGLDPEVLEIREEGEVLWENTYRISAVFVKHAGNMPTLTYRIEAGGKSVVITGDGIPSPKLTELCRGADLLVSECSGTEEFLSQYPWGAWHTTPQTLGKMASQAQVKRVMLKHFVIEDITGDLKAAERMAEQVRQDYSGEVIVGEDGLTVEI